MDQIKAFLESSGSIIAAVLVSVTAGVVANIFTDIIQSMIAKKSVPSITNMLEELIRRIKAPKWYHKNPDAIDPGLIEVAVAITAVIIALPAFVTPEIPEDQAFILKSLWFVGQFFPVLVSINLLEIYARNKGSESKHILLSPISDGSFFLLGWSIVFVFVFISVAAFLAG